MGGSARRIFGLVLAGLLGIGVVAAVVVPHRSGSNGRHGGRAVAVKGLVGSEKLAFFQDPAVTAAFRRAGYQVQVDPAGSREMADRKDLGGYDFAFPAGSPQADQIKRDHKVARSYVPFFTPMVVASFRPIAMLLTAAGVARMQDGHYVLDMRRYLALVEKQTRWSQLPGNTTYRTDKSLLISTTDVRTSNSAAMYLALTSYVANGDDIVTDPPTADRVADRLAPLFLKQGYLEESSQDPFDDYLSIGIGKTPLVLAYEAQYLARAAAGDGSITPDRVLMYPSPTTYAKHTVVPLTPRGDAIGRLLTTDPTLQHLAVRYGFRTADAGYDRQYAAGHHLPPPPDLADVVEPPAYGQLDRMIVDIEKRY